MPRRYRRRYSTRRPLKTVKYSNETSNLIGPLTITSTDTGSQINAPLVSAVNTQGMRKAKNFTLKLIYGGNTPLIWALVYVPQGQTPSKLTRGSADTPASMYEPNQNVIMSGFIVPTYQQAQVYRTRLARNLNSGDSIQLLVATALAGATVTEAPIGATLNYAITY